VAFVPPARHLLKARDLADAHYTEQIGVEEMAQAAGLSKAHFSREFRRNTARFEKTARNRAPSIAPKLISTRRNR
jgi:AraC-like DNA-binding protein